MGDTFSWCLIGHGTPSLRSVLTGTDYDSRKEHDVHKALINGPAPPVLDGLQSETHVFVIHPNTNERTRVYYAPYTVIHLYWGIKEDEWTKLAPEFMAAVAKSDACTGYIWGEVDKPVLSDPNGYSKLGSGKGGVLASGWRSRYQYDRDSAKARFVDAYKAMDQTCEKKDSWGMSLTVTENTGHIHGWRTPLAVKDRTGWLPAAGII